MARAHENRAATHRIGRACPGFAKDERCGREIRTGNDFEQFFRRDRRVVHEREAAVDHFAKVVRRNVGRHADRDTACAVDQQVRETGRKHGRFAARPVVVVGEVDRILVEIVEQGIGDTCKPRFGVTHGCRWIRVHRAEVTLTIDQRHA